MDVALTSLINLYQFSTGRLTFALMGVDERLREHRDDLGAISEHLAKALHHARTTRQPEQQFAAAQAAPQGNARAIAVDAKLDRALVALRDATQAHITGADHDDLNAVLANKLLATCMPRGVTAITQTTFVEQLSLVDAMLAELRAHHTDTVKALGLAPFVTRIAKLNGEYRAALQTDASPAVDFSAVRAARQRGQEFLLEVTAMIMGRYPLQTPAHVMARQNLLMPILTQNEAIGVYLRSRRSPQDVNPDTGDVAPVVEPVAVVTDPNMPVD